MSIWLRNRFLGLNLLVVLVVFGFSFRQEEPGTIPRYPTDIKETSDNQFLVSNKGAKTVDLYTVFFDKLLRSWSFKDVPTGIATQGEYAYITTSGSSGAVHFLNLKTGEIEKSLVTGSGANTPLLAPDGNTLYVLNQFQNTVSKVSLHSQQVVASVDVLREPRNAVIEIGRAHV